MVTNRVNPPRQLELPPEIASNKQLKKAFDDRDFILFQLWKRTGASSDFISDLQGSDEQFEDFFQPDAVAQVKDDFVKTSVDYTTVGNQTVECNARGITINLNAEPDDQELVKIVANERKITINANGKTINEELDALIRRKDTVWNIKYIIEKDGWRII